VRRWKGNEEGLNVGARSSGPSINATNESSSSTPLVAKTKAFHPDDRVGFLPRF
jgi:hypothetical protein